MKHKPGETMEEFVARLRPVAARLGYDDLAIRDQFLAGLREKVEEQVYIYIILQCPRLLTHCYM